jgi:hypothetical protein
MQKLLATVSGYAQLNKNVTQRSTHQKPGNASPIDVDQMPRQAIDMNSMPRKVIDVSEKPRKGISLRVNGTDNSLTGNNNVGNAFSGCILKVFFSCNLSSTTYPTYDLGIPH